MVAMLSPASASKAASAGAASFLARTVGLAMAALLLAGCATPRLVRIQVPPEDIIRANEAAKEGDLAFARKDYYAALIKYLEASRSNPNSEYVQNKLGITYSQLKYYREATDAFLRSIALNAKYPYSYNNLGSVYFAIDDKRRAEKYFRKAISINPKVASFHINLGSLYFEKRKFAKGIAEWRLGVSLDPEILQRSEGVSLVAAGTRGAKSDRAYFQARLFASMGDVERAVQSLEQAISAGFSDIDSIRKEPDFDPIRQDERFQAFMKTALLLSNK